MSNFMKRYVHFDKKLKEMIVQHAIYMNSDMEYGECADFTDMELSNMSFSGMCLAKATFAHANLENCEFSFCDLRGADFRCANLSGARFTGATLLYANFQNAELTNVIGLSDSYYVEAKFDNNMADKIPMACPEEGGFVAWKKCTYEDGKDAIVKLFIPEDAMRSSGTGRKCRASRAKVLDIQLMNGRHVATAWSKYDPAFQYVVGRYVEPRLKFNGNRFATCASGIHFFTSRADAKAYVY